MRNPLKLLAPSNPCTFFASGNGSLAAKDKNGDFSLTSSGALRYQAANGARTNLVYDPQQRAASPGTNWGNFGSGASLTAIANDGPLGLATSIEASTSGANAGIELLRTRVGKIAAKTAHTYTVWLKSVSGSAALTLRVRSYDAAGNIIASAVNASAITISGGWAAYSISATPSGVGEHCLSLAIFSTSAPGTFRLSAVQLEQGALATPYFDGSLGGVWLDPITGQLGTAHASPSVSQAAFWVEEGTTNLIQNPRCEAAVTNWSNAAAGMTGSARDTTYSYIGSASYKCVCDGTIAQQGVVPTGGQEVVATNGQTFTVSCYARGAGTVKIGVTERDSTGTALGSIAQGSAVVLSDSWQRLTFTYTMTQATAAYIRPNILLSAQAANTFWVTDFQCEQKAYATSYCDGSLGNGYSWSGTAHASSSTRAATLVKFDEANRIFPDQGAIIAIALRNVDTGAIQYVFQTGDNASGKDRITLYADTDDALKLGMLSQPSANVVASSGASMTTGTWFPIYADWTPSRQRATVGASTGSANRNVPNNVIATANDASIGTPNTGGTNALNGAIGPVAIYSRPLTDAELAKVIALGPSLAFDSLKALA